jgi:hypothetical protein
MLKYIPLRNNFITPTAHVRLAVREQPVNNQAKDREHEDDDAPQQLVGRRAVGLEDFHCTPLH